MSSPEEITPSRATVAALQLRQSFIHTELVARGCSDLRVTVRPSVARTDLAYVKIEDRARRQAVEVTGEDFDSILQHLGERVSTTLVLGYLRACPSATTA